MNARQQKTMVKKLIAQRDEARESSERLRIELDSERTERASLIAEAVREGQVMLERAHKIIADLRQGTVDLASCVTAREVEVKGLRAQVDGQNRELLHTREDAKNANAAAARLLEELHANATLAEVKDLRKRLQTKTTKVVELERELEKLRPTAVKLDVHPRVVGTAKP